MTSVLERKDSSEESTLGLGGFDDAPSPLGLHFARSDMPSFQPPSRLFPRTTSHAAGRPHMGMFPSYGSFAVGDQSDTPPLPPRGVSVDSAEGVSPLANALPLPKSASLLRRTRSEGPAHHTFNITRRASARLADALRKEKVLNRLKKIKATLPMCTSVPVAKGKD